MKRTALKRNVGLKPKAPVAMKPGSTLKARQKPIPKMSPKVKADQGRRRKEKAAVLERDEVCALVVLKPGHVCMGGPELHHVLKATRGGKYTAANGKLLCSLANQWVEDYPLEAEALGLSKPSQPLPGLLYDRRKEPA